MSEKSETEELIEEKFNKGEYLTIDEYNILEKYYLRVIEINPETIGPRIGLSHIYAIKRQNLDRGFRLLNEVYSENITNGMYYNNLATYYAKGYGCERDVKKAIQLYEKSGCPLACFTLSKFYLEGKVVEKNREKAITLLRNGAENCLFSCRVCMVILGEEVESERGYWAFRASQKVSKATENWERVCVDTEQLKRRLNNLLKDRKAITKFLQRTFTNIVKMLKRYLESDLVYKIIESSLPDNVIVLY